MRTRIVSAVVLATLLLTAPARSQQLVRQVRAHVDTRNVAAAQQIVETNRPPQPRITSEWLAAASWVARIASFAGQWDLAQKYAQETFDRSVEMLAKRPLDADNDLPTALGAAIEVLAHSYDTAGERGAAVSFLDRQRDRYRGTSIETRIQKNLLLLSLEGKPLPELAVEHRLGPESFSATQLKGKVALFYFWAHWCGDCKAQKPILEALHQQYSGKGLTIVGPTQFYGYISRGQDATPEQELDYLKNAYQQSNPLPGWMSIPISNRNFVNFGVSTTPTLVLVDRGGVVRMYHPGNMSQQELEERILPLLSQVSD